MIAGGSLALPPSGGVFLDGAPESACSEIK